MDKKPTNENIITVKATIESPSPGQQIDILSEEFMGLGQLTPANTQMYINGNQVPFNSKFSVEEGITEYNVEFKFNDSILMHSAKVLRMDPANR